MNHTIKENWLSLSLQILILLFFVSVAGGIWHFLLLFVLIWACKGLVNVVKTTVILYVFRHPMFFPEQNLYLTLTCPHLWRSIYTRVWHVYLSFRVEHLTVSYSGFLDQISSRCYLPFIARSIFSGEIKKWSHYSISHFLAHSKISFLVLLNLILKE